MPLLSWAALGAGVFACVFLFGHWWELAPGRGRRRGMSAAAGASCAYVFVYLMPELARAGKAFVAATAHRSLPFAEYRVYLAALAGFVVFYGLESIVAWSSESRQGGSEARRARDPVFFLHLGGFVAYVWLTTYLMVCGVREAPLSLFPFIAAMGLHFLTIDHALEREHGITYERCGRYILAASALLGWGCRFLGELPQPVITTFLGVISGGVIINSMVMELPREKEGRFVWFLMGAAAYAALLLVVG